MEGAMSSVAQIAQILGEVLEEEANRLGRETGWQQRERALSGADARSNASLWLVAGTRDQPGWTHPSCRATPGADYRQRPAPAVHARGGPAAFSDLDPVGGGPLPPSTGGDLAIFARLSSRITGR